MTVAIHAVYVTSLLLTVCPLVHIVARKRLSRYFAYFVATSSFLCLNLLGSISPNILGREPSLDLHLAHLSIAFALFLLYLAIDAAAPRTPTPVAFRLLDSAHDNRVALGCYVGFLLLVGLVGSVAFYLTVSPPLLFEYELFGMREALVAKRVAITFSRSYHWYALALFEIPLFTVILLNVLRHIPGRRREIWALTFWLVTPVSTAASVMLLQKQNVLYLLASMLLVLMVFRNHLPLRSLTVFVAGGAIVVALLYLVFVGPDLMVEAVPVAMAHRVFEAVPWSSAVAFDLFPREVPFLEGTSFINFFQMFDYEQANPAKLVYPRIYGDMSGQAPLPAVTEMYANYGWSGIGIGIVLAMGLVFVASVLSWSTDVWWFSVAIYLAIKTVFIWLVPFWFGILEATLVVLVFFLFSSFRIVWALTGRNRYP